MKLFRPEAEICLEHTICVAVEKGRYEEGILGFLNSAELIY